MKVGSIALHEEFLNHVREREVMLSGKSVPLTAVSQSNHATDDP
jgi:hypothetical protein